MLRYLTLALLIPINTISAIDHNEFLRGLDISEVQKAIAIDECYLIISMERVLFISTDFIDSFAIYGESISLLIDSLQEEVEFYKRDPFQYNSTSYQKLLTTLYAHLLTPIKANLAFKIFVVSVPQLRAIPWNALSPKEGEFLIENHEITLDYHWIRNTKFDFGRREHSIHIIAPEFKGALALESKAEQKQIERLLPFGSTQINESSIIHVSSHGFLATDTWEKSGILLANDEVLSNARISSICLRSNLVFLNICEGAKLWQNQQSIVDAFHQAGAEAIVGALWEIDDYMAVKVSEEFYENLLQGQRIGQALRLSLLSYKDEMEELGQLNPINWTGYQLYGQNVNIVDKTELAFKKISSIVLSLCTSLSLFFYYFGNRLKSKIFDYNLV